MCAAPLVYICSNPHACMSSRPRTVAGSRSRDSVMIVVQLDDTLLPLASLICQMQVTGGGRLNIPRNINISRLPSILPRSSIHPTLETREPLSDHISRFIVQMDVGDVESARAAVRISHLPPPPR